MVADLHIHSNFSDGINSPEEVVRLAKEVNLKTISLTDHDVIEGVTSAQAEGEKLGVEVISGIEFTTELPRTEVHILGYFIDCRNPRLLEVLEKIQRSREERIYKMVEKLNHLNIELEPEEVFSLSKGKSLGRPHVARALLAKGVVGSVKEAFDRFLDFHAPAYVPHYKLTPIEAIRLIKEAGGIAVYAHPGVSNCDEIIPDLIGEGLRGLEVYYTGHRPEQTNHYLNLAQKYGLLVTGGSDFHGLNSGREVKLGDLTISDELVERLRNEYLCRN